MEQAGKPGEKRRGDRGKKDRKTEQKKQTKKRKGNRVKNGQNQRRKNGRKKEEWDKRGKQCGRRGRSETFEQHVGVNGDSLALADIAETLVGPRRNTDGGGIEAECVREGEAHGVDVF